MYHLPVKDCKRIFDVRNRTYVHYSQPCVLTDSVCEKNPDTSPLKSVNVETLIKKLYLKKEQYKSQICKNFWNKFLLKKTFWHLGDHRFTFNCTLTSPTSRKSIQH